jgi:hypothetical protein
MVKWMSNQPALWTPDTKILKFHHHNTPSIRLNGKIWKEIRKCKNIVNERNKTSWYSLLRFQTYLKPEATFTLNIYFSTDNRGMWLKPMNYLTVFITSTRIKFKTNVQIAQIAERNQVTRIAKEIISTFELLFLPYIKITKMSYLFYFWFI